MPKPGKTEVVACCEAVSRGTKIYCEFCTKSWHTKCANITANVLKLLRDTGGACWLCPTCRSPDGRQPASGDTNKLILQRVTSALLLIGNLTDTMRVFCKMYSISVSTPGTTVPPSTAAYDPDLSDAFHANLSNLFDSILGDGNKRPRTSSLSRSASVQPEKMLRVDVPVDLTTVSNTTIPPVSDAADAHHLATAQPPCNSISRLDTSQQFCDAVADQLPSSQLATSLLASSQQSTAATVEPVAAPPLVDFPVTALQQTVAQPAPSQLATAAAQPNIPTTAAPHRRWFCRPSRSCSRC